MDITGDWDLVMGYKQQSINTPIHYWIYNETTIDTATIHPRKYDKKSTKGIGKLKKTTITLQYTELWHFLHGMRTTLAKSPPICSRNTWRIQSYTVSKNSLQWISWRYTEYIPNCLLGWLVITIFICISVYLLICNYFVYGVQNATNFSHWAPCPARDLFHL